MQHHALSRSDAPLRAQRGDAVRHDERGIELALVEAAVDDMQACRRRAVARADQVGGVVRVGDHRLAARHHAVVEPLHGTLFGIGAMVGRDERHASAPRRHQRAPRRCAAARMHEVDALCPHDAGDLVRVPREPHRVLDGSGKELQLRARIAQALHEPPALAQHNGAPARLRDGARDLDGRQLSPAGVKLRDDLQYGRALGGHEAVSRRRRGCLV